MAADNKSNMKKCGEILINLKKKNKKSRTYTFHCTFCETSWDQMKKFSMHLEELHLANFEDESGDIPMIYEPEIKIELAAENKVLETENKTFPTEIAKDDPLEMEASVAIKSLDNDEYCDVQIKVEGKNCNDTDMNIKTEDTCTLYENNSDDNDEDYKPIKEVI